MRFKTCSYDERYNSKIEINSSLFAKILELVTWQYISIHWKWQPKRRRVLWTRDVDQCLRNSTWDQEFVFIENNTLRHEEFERMPDTDNWDMFAHTCRGSSFLYTVVTSRPTSFVETYIHLLLDLRLSKTLYYQNFLGYQCLSIIYHILHLCDNNLTCYFIHLSTFLWVYKLIRLLLLFRTSALFKLPIYLHTYYISNAGCLEAFDQALKTYKQTRGPVANTDPQFTPGGTVQCSTVYPSARPDPKIRNRH